MWNKFACILLNIANNMAERPEHFDLLVTLQVVRDILMEYGNIATQFPKMINISFLDATQPLLVTFKRIVAWLTNEWELNRIDKQQFNCHVGMLNCIITQVKTITTVHKSKLVQHSKYRQVVFNTEDCAFLLTQTCNEKLLETVDDISCEIPAGVVEKLTQQFLDVERLVSSVVGKDTSSLGSYNTQDNLDDELEWVLEKIRKG